MHTQYKAEFRNGSGGTTFGVNFVLVTKGMFSLVILPVS